MINARLKIYHDSKIETKCKKYNDTTGTICNV